MASSATPALAVPKAVKDVTLPHGKALPHKQPEYPAEDKLVTGWALTHAVKHAGGNIVAQIALNKMEAKNMVVLRAKVQDGNFQFRALAPSRPQNSEAILINVYGTVQSGDKACSGCKKGNGPFQECTVLSKGEACCNCHYNSGASKCSFNSTAKRAGTPSLTTPRKMKASRLEADFLLAIRGIRPRQLRVLGDAILGLAGKLDSVGYDPDKPLQVVAESDDESDH